MIKSAKFSDDGRYRYALRRSWDPAKPTVLFVGLNPSTADDRVDDATIRRCVRFAQDWEFGSLLVANLFAFRTQSPTVLRKASDPIGPHNDWWLRRLKNEADVTVVAWGNAGRFLDRNRQVLELLGPVKCLELTKLDQPKHPLYVRASVKLRELGL